MLSPADLVEALKEGQAAADCCGHWCRAGAAIDGEWYVIHHNGISGRDTDSAVIHAVGVLGLSKDGLAAKIKTWIGGLHAGERFDLNATMATGGPITAGVPYIVGERDCEFIVLPARDSMTPGHTHEVLDPEELVNAWVKRYGERGPVTTGWGWPHAVQITDWVITRKE